MKGYGFFSPDPSSLFQLNELNLQTFFPFEAKNGGKIKEVLSLVKEFAHDRIFEMDGRKKYHVNGTQPVHLLDNICRPLVMLEIRNSGDEEKVNSVRIELLKIMQKALEKAESIQDQDVEKIKKVIEILNQPDIFSKAGVTRKIADEIELFDLKPQVIINRGRNGGLEQDPELN